MLLTKAIWEKYDDDTLILQLRLEMAVSGLIATSRTNTHEEAKFDHAIKLIDTTKPEAEPDRNAEESATLAPTDAPLDRRGTRGTLREELARRKYAKWQEDKPKNGDDPAATSDEESKNGKDGVTLRTSRLRDKIPFRSRKGEVVAENKDGYAIDILYENQRGSFLCGIPLYSAKSLLNLDPGPWQTSTFTDSAVNITNAQVPDPSWTWAWKSWYVDMSHDVDEEGWEYSFSFQKGFAWHGSHPWFHSFVRRRRWLRKRIKIHPSKGYGKKGSARDAHMLTADYFTIHAKRDTSRGSSADRATNNHSSYVSSTGNYGDDSDIEIGEISDIAALMTVLRKARVDREKIAAVKNFIDHGGDELYYLCDRMSDIMAVLIYQTSRQHLQAHLRQILDEATKELEGHEGGEDSEAEASKRKVGNLRKAVNAADEHVNDLEYWSDLRAKTTNSNPPHGGKNTAQDATAGNVEEIEKKTREESGEVGNEIRGIPEDAGISEEPGIRWDKGQDDVHDTGPSAQAKGKGRA